MRVDDVYVCVWVGKLTSECGENVRVFLRDGGYLFSVFSEVFFFIE